MSRRQFIIIGLGVFGETIARELTRLGHEVVGIDVDERIVDRLADTVTHAMVADGSDERVLEELNVSLFDAAIVAIGERNMEANLLATLHLKAIGLKEVWVKAVTADHHRILAKIGASRILHPEYEMGMHVAQALNYPMVNDYISLGSDEYIVEITASEKLDGLILEDVFQRAGADVTLLLAKRNGNTFPRQDNFVIDEGDCLVLAGKLDQLKKAVEFV